MNEDDCAHCKGTGDDWEDYGEDCYQCNGGGNRSANCTTCRGEGLVSNYFTLKVDIPPSIDNGMYLRVKEKGHQALNGHWGDVIIKVEVLEHPKFRREGHDIFSTEKISLTTALLGGTQVVETVYGAKKFKINPDSFGADFEPQFRYGGRGLQHVDNEDKFGDHVVTFDIEIPTKLTSEQKKFLNNYAQVDKKVDLKH